MALITKFALAILWFGMIDLGSMWLLRNIGRKQAPHGAFLH